MLVPAIALVITSVALFLLLIVSCEQLCLTNTSSKNNIFTLKTGIFIGLIFEFTQSIMQLLLTYKTNRRALHNYQRIAHFLCWFNFLCLLCAIHNLVISLTPTTLSAMRRIWSIVTMVHIIWLSICFILFVITTSSFYETVYYFGLHSYLIFGCFFMFTVSFFVRSALRNCIISVSEIQIAQCNEYDVYRNSDEKNNTITKSAISQKQLSAATFPINATISLSIVVFIVAIFAIYFNIVAIQKTVGSVSSAPFSAIDLFVIHYMCVIIFYVLPLLNHWIPFKEMPSDSLYNGFKSKVTEKQIDIAGKEDIERTKASTLEQEFADKKNVVVPHLAVPHLQKSGKSKSKSKSVSVPLSANDTLDFTANDMIVLDDYNSAKSQDDPDLFDHEDIFDINNELSAAEARLPLHNITNSGRAIGRRGVAKPPRMKNMTRLSGVPSTKMMTAAITEESVQIETVLDLLDTIEDVTVSPIELIIFRFDNALCTNIGKIQNKSQHCINSMSLTEKELVFGGTERVKALQLFLQNIATFCVDEEVKCFVITDEKCKTVAKLLNDMHLLKYFGTRNNEKGNMEQKCTSNIIGFDHEIYRESNGKKHLILLKLLHNLDKRHAEMLYIGYDPQVVDHLQSIKVCKTYLCTTKGLAQNDLDEIFSMHF